MSGKVVPLRPRKPRTSDLVERAVAEGRPLPLTVMIESMWRLVDEAVRLESSGNSDDAMLARVARDRALRVAGECAPYFHPKLASTVISGDEDNPLKVQQAHSHRFDRLTDEQATRFLEAIAAGEMTIEQVDAELG